MEENAIISGPVSRSFKPYPSYKDSGVKWLGKIPAHWGLKRLKRIVEFRGGGTPSKDNLDYWSGDIPWVSPKDMKVSVVVDTEEKITPQAVCESATKLVPPGAVLLVVRSGILIHSIPAALSGREVTLNQDLKALIPRSALLPEYLLFLISGMQTELLAEWKKEGATVESLEMDLIAQTQTPLPGEGEQRAIAAFLDHETAKIDALIAKNERLIELLQEKRTALITQAVSKGLDPNVPMKDSGVEWLDKIPAHWEVKRLKCLSSVNDETLSEKTDPLFELVYVDIGGVDQNRGIVKREEHIFEKAPSRARRIVKDGDIIISTVRTYLRAIAPIQNPEPNLICSTGFAVVRPSSGLQSEFAAYALRAVYFVEQVVANSVGVSYPAIDAGKMSGFTLPIPDVEDQRAIAAFLNRETAKIDDLIAKIQVAIERLKEYRTATISAAVTGKIDVRGTIA